MNPVQPLELTSGMRQGAAIVVLALAVVLLIPDVVVAQSPYSFRVIYVFCSLQNCADGAGPTAGLIADGKGNGYGTTQAGDGFGNVFEVTRSGKETVLYNFQGGTDGENPDAGLTRDSAGNLYGTTYDGRTGGCGQFGCGTLFRLNPPSQPGGAWIHQVIHNFQGGTDGEYPEAGLTRDSAGNLYGTTFYGGDPNCNFGFGCGTVFKLDTAGNETVLHSFTLGADSGFPEGGLIIDRHGNLYGTTYGQANGNDTPGTVFQVAPDGRETILYTFNNPTQGYAPVGNLLMDTEGNLYGTTSTDYVHGYGTVYKLAKTEEGIVEESVLWQFQGSPDGANPKAGVVMDTEGNLYGTTYAGGDGLCPINVGGCGTVFKLAKNGEESVLYAFTAGGDGELPVAPVILDPKGDVYGTTLYGGRGAEFFPYGGGVVFGLSPQ